MESEALKDDAWIHVIQDGRVVSSVEVIELDGRDCRIAEHVLAPGTGLGEVRYLWRAPVDRHSKTQAASGQEGKCREAGYLQSSWAAGGCGEAIGELWRYGGRTCYGLEVGYAAVTQQFDTAATDAKVERLPGADC
jgi:hypothetical protein